VRIDGEVIDVPVVKIDVDTPYYVGTIEALAMECPVYDLVLGNLDGVRNFDDPDLDWKPTRWRWQNGFKRWNCGEQSNRSPGNQRSFWNKYHNKSRWTQRGRVCPTCNTVNWC